MPGRNEHRAWLGLGGNIGDPTAAMAAVLHMLDAAPSTRVVAVSSLYRTPPWGRLDQPYFLNAAAEIATGLSPRELLDLCLEAEIALKRVRMERWGPRTIDVDLLVYEGVSMRVAGLELPHPRLLERGFVLLPLTEIAPDLTIAGKKVAAHAEAIGCKGIERQDGGPDWWRR